ncbi:uncharacterized protein [Drosophila takahashii]|uniref:uncharacterized protein n=1 Tax=Drosophila takahashii TaxID=29030 RepID=UPI0007E70851|nr:keratin-associated protein 9-1 [Drosophila takahashii]KAH8353711.1 hypothetical protein KR084_012846 [Drosophila pseudotakahashii]
MCCNPGGCCNLPTCIQCTNFCFNCWTGTAAVPCCRRSCIPGCCGSPGCRC